MTQLHEQDPVNQAQTLCEAIEKLSHVQWDKFYEHRLLHLERQWRGQHDYDAVLAQRFEQAATRCRDIINEHKKYSEVSSRQKTLVDQLKEHCASLNQNARSLTDTNEQIEKYQTQWREESEISIPKKTLHKQWDRQIELLKNYLLALERLCEHAPTMRSLSNAQNAPLEENLNQAHDLLKQIDWPDKLAYPPDLQDFYNYCNQLDQSKQQKIATREEKLRRADKLIAKLRGLLRVQNTRVCIKVRKELTQYLETLSEQERASYQQRLEVIDKDLQELMDWKSFASKPKILQLCASMEELANKPLTPKDQLQSLRQLQKQWSQLGNSESTEEAWPRFKEATDKAIQPCAELIAQHKAYLAKNQEFAERACEQLESCLSELESGSFDWKNIKQRLENSDGLMERNKRLPKAQAQTIHERYQTLRTACDEKLVYLVKQHEEQKQMLLTRAEKLAEQKAGVEQTRQAKQLLGHWDQLLKGAQEDELRARLEQTLKTVLDELRLVEDQEHQESTTLKQNIREAIDTMKQWVRLEDAELQGVNSQYRELRERVTPLLEKLEPAPTPAPRSKHRSKTARTRVTLQQEFLDAARQLEQHLAGLPHRQRQLGQDTLKKYVSLCQDLEWSVAKSKDAAVNALNEATPLLQNMDAKMRVLMETRRDVAIAAKQDGDAMQRKLLCIRLEIYADIPTPDEDADLRSQYLLEQMQQGVRVGAMSDEEIRKQAQALYMQYLAGPVADKALEQNLAERVEIAMKNPALQMEQKKAAQHAPQKPHHKKRHTHKRRR